MEIVELTEKDSKDMIKLDKLSYGEDYGLPPLDEDQIGGVVKSGFMLGIREEGELVSNIHIKKQEDGWYVFTCCTSPSHQGKGLAKKLLEKVLEMSKKEGNKRITATIKPSNINSLKLFEKKGFKKVKYLKDHYGKGKHRILMEYKI